MTKKKRTKCYLPLILCLSLLLSGCGKEAPSTAAGSTQEITTAESSTESAEETTQKVTVEDSSTEPEEKTFPVTKEYVKLSGRTAENNGIRWMIHSASKAEFRFRGTKASIVVRSDASLNGAQTNRTRLAVYVNGERTLEHIVGKMEETLEIYSSEKEQEVEIAVVKLSEATTSVFGLKSIIVTASGDIEPLPEKQMKIEFIGDSITCGYGVDDENRDHHFSTATEDATKTYAYKTAEALNADYSFISYSGHGIISGYSGDGNVRDTQRIPDVYELIGKNYGSADAVVDLSAKWNFSEFVPDHVVINLGTNDETYTLARKEREEEYIKAYVDFLKMVRKDNPGAHITAALGIMGDGLYHCIEEAVKQYSEETGDTNVSALRFTPQDGSTGYAADWHPTEATNEIAAKELTEHIRAH